MEALLPSEIARLVLGYLEDQQCAEAAKHFLESSPHLQECRTVVSCGKRFSTKVNGLTLTDVIEKFSAISTMIQERLNKATDCEQLKHCGDLIEQLKFLVEEPRGQRFVVNINVPSQNNTQASNGSPILANNMRRRRHSNSERNKRPIKSQSNTTQQPDVLTTSPISHNVDTTLLESLPGNVSTFKQAESINNRTEKRDNNVAHESLGQYDFEKNDAMWSTQHFEADFDGKRKEITNIMTSTPSLKRCTTATNTEELLQFSSAEVQTTPYEIPESESESNDEPIENLSILTKEILNRTELQECIAENINRAIIPTDLSLRDECFNESIGGEGNTSIMAELNNAIKSIVEATETDPVFEKFLDEIIGPHTETDTSPEEDGEGKQSPKFLNEAEQEKHVATAFGNVSSPEPIIVDTRASAENNAADVPLKHRLRSSSRQQNNRIEDEAEKIKDQEKEQSSLEDQNAAAVLSIVNANITNNTSSEKKTVDDVKESMVTGEIIEENVQVMIPAAVSKEDATTKSLTSSNIQRMSNVVPSANGNTESKVKKSTVKRPRPTRPKRDQTINDNQIMTKQDMLTTPTLVVCSKEEISNLLSMSHSSTITSRFIPIAPKDPNRPAGPNRIAGSLETMYLRTVNLAQKLPNEPGNSTSGQASSQRSTTKVSKTVKTVHKVDATLTPVIIDQRPLIPTEPIQMIGKLAAGESQVITLYGNESSAKTSLDSANMPTINLEENISLSESGLSPYMKFNCSKIGQSHNLSDIDLTPVMENAKCTATTTMTINATTAEQQPTVSTNTDIITKRTPKSLLKSRSKNRRLSLSTPRKRSSHIRALDFSTPPKVISSARKANANETTKRLKSVCRTSLFKSPSFSSSSAMTQKQQSPVKVCQSYKIPIATRSPAPKLMGGWDKFNGVGVIIGDVSSHGSTSASSSSEDRAQHKTSKTPAEIWDADLRKGLESSKKDETEVKKPAKRKHSNKDGNSVTHKRSKYNQQSTKSRDKKKSCETSQKTEDANEHPQENAKTTTTENNHDVITVSASNLSTSKSDKIAESGDVSETSTKTDATSIPSNDAMAEKKPVKKYVQLKTIRTNLKKPNDDETKKSAEDAGQTMNRSQMSELSRILSSTSTQHMLQMPDMIDVETPRKFNNDGTSMPPPTPRMLSPGNNAVTPFIKLSEDSSRLRSSFISTPEFPITPCIALTPKHTEETTRDVVKKNEYRSPYYEPSCEQVAGEKDGISKNTPVVSAESPVISSSHIKLQSTHNSLAAAGTSYQTCTSTTKLEITQFEVIKENLPKEEAIKELKIASNNTKDSTMELNAVTSSASVVAVDLIQINELPSASVERHHQTSISEHNYTTESNSSSSSDISSSSDSSSSSSSTSTTDSSSSCSSNNKSNLSPTKNLNAHEDTDVVAATQSNENNPDINPAIVDESSPRKVFAIEKTDDQLQATPQETPAKDETLLNEADISETPSSSKSGIENLTNLSTKISAIITEDEKLSKLTNSQKDSSNKTFNRARSKPKVTNVQCIRPESSKAAIEELVKAAGDSHAHQPTMYNKLIVQLEEKRQRMIAKFRDAPKSNIASGTTRKRMLISKASNDARSKNAQFTKLNIRQAASSKHPQGNRDRDKPATVPPSQTVFQESNPAKNTRKRCEMQKQSSASGCGDRDEEKRKQTTSRNVNLSTTTSHVNSDRPPNDSETKQTHVSNVGNAKSNSSENFNNIETESARSHATKSSLEERDHSKERLNAKENAERSCDVNTGREEVRKSLEDDTAHTKVSEKEAKPAERHIVAQETLVSGDKAKSESRDHVENRASKSRQFASHIDKAKCILKCKVDQVKRDLFSDEENDQRVSVCVATSQREKAHKTTEETQQNSAPVKEVSSVSQENVHVENPKEELSSVLQCLQLVPAHKNENELGQNEKQQQQLNENRSRLEDTSEDDGNKSEQKTATVPNYKAEYHFVYDDSAPVRKRRRRYSGHELQIEINHADLSDPNPVECITVLKATEFEEIFNLQPKNSKKRTLSKKTSHKSETFAMKTDNEVIISKDNTKSLTTASSSVDEASGTKAKKLSIKTATANRTGNDAQSDLKKKSKPDKTQEKVLETAAKSRKRKLSETKETKQIEKSCTTDPQTLLSNIDLNKFLTTVHGPE